MANLITERKAYYKMLLSSLPFELQVEELGNELSDNDLHVLLEQFKEDEEYEICRAFQHEIDRRKSAAAQH